MTNEIDLRQLRYFAAVAEQLSFGKAAKVLHISQPPLSRQIRSLETSLGVVLLNRSHQGVSLTPAGMVFLSEIRQILQRVEQARVLAKRAEYGQAGELKVGYCSYLDTVLNSFLAARFRGESELRLRSHSLPSSDQVELLRNRILDVGIVHLPLPDTDHLTVELLCHEPIVAMVARDHPLSARRRVSLVDLGKQESLVPRRQSFPLVHHQIHRVC